MSIQRALGKDAQKYIGVSPYPQAITGATGEAPTPPVEPSTAQFLVLAVKEKSIPWGHVDEIGPGGEMQLFTNAESMQHAVTSLKKDPLVKEIYIFKMMYGCKSKREWENSNVDV